MPSPSTELQGALYGALSGDIGVTSLATGGIHDRVPENRNFPYVSIGEDDFTQLNASCITANEHSFDVHVWSRAVGRVESKELGFAVQSAIPETIDLPTHAATNVVFRGERDIGDPDGLTSHRVLTFYCRIEVRL